jgi:transposase
VGSAPHRPDLPADHDCPWRHEALVLRGENEALKTRVGELEGKLVAVLATVEVLQRQVFGPKSEKMPPPASELRHGEPPEEAEERRLAGLRRRRARAALKEKLREEKVVHPVPDEKKKCPRCGGVADRKLGDGKETFIYEYVPGYFVRQRHVQEKVACTCGEYIATADPPPKPVEGGHYGAGFVAHLCVMKCADSIPLHRLAKQYQRLGIPMSRSTLTDLFHAAATKLAPLSQRLLQIIASADVVQADETPMVMQHPHKKGYVWAFLADGLIAYRFSPSRSGETPSDVLGGSKGTLVVDAYTGYNRVTDVDGRARSGCIAHVRRKFFDALPTAPDAARRALDLILDIYRVEHEAKARQIVRTSNHLALRQTKSRHAMDAFHAWLHAEQDRHLPKGPLGLAIAYAINQWDVTVRARAHGRAGGLRGSSADVSPDSGRMAHGRS